MPLRLAAAAVAIAAFLLVPAAQAGSRTEFQAHLARALHARHVSSGRTGAIVLDLQTGAQALRPQPAARAQAGLEREARHDLCRPDRARPLVPNRHRRARRGPAGRSDVAGEPRAQGLRGPGAVLRPAQLARAPGGGGRDQARERPDPRRRELVRHAPHRARLEAGFLPPRVAGALGTHRQPRLDGTVRDEAARPDGGPGLPARPAPRGRHRARRGCGRRRLGAGGSARRGRVGTGRHARAPHGRLQRQLLRRDAAEGDRRGAGQRRLLRGRRRGGAATARRCRRAARTASGWSTAPASRCSTVGRPSASRRCCARCGRTATCDPTSSPPCRSPARRGRSCTGCAWRRPAASCAPRRARRATRRRSRASSATATSSRSSRTAARCACRTPRSRRTASRRCSRARRPR